MSGIHAMAACAISGSSPCQLRAHCAAVRVPLGWVPPRGHPCTGCFDEVWCCRLSCMYQRRLEGWGQEWDAEEGRGGPRKCTHGTARAPWYGPTWHTSAVVLLNGAINQIYSYTGKPYGALGELHLAMLQELSLQFLRGRPGRGPLRVWPKVGTFLASVPSNAY